MTMKTPVDPPFRAGSVPLAPFVISVLLLLPTGAYVGAKIYEETYQYWKYGPSVLGGITDVGIHSGYFLPLLGLFVVDALLLLPSLASLLDLGFLRRSPSSSTRTLARVLGLVGSAVVALAFVPSVSWHRLAWSLAGPGPSGALAMLDAASSCDVATFEWLERHGASRDRERTLEVWNGGGRAFGRVALVEAAEAGCDPLVRRLLASGVDRDRLDARGMSAIEAAQRRGHGEVVERLSAPASPNATGVR